MNLPPSKYAEVILGSPPSVAYVILIDDYSHKMPHFYSCQGL
jgi:hypothetical protein